MLPRMLARSIEIPAALAQLCSAPTSPTAFCALLTWLQKPSTAPWPWLAAMPPRAAVSAAAAVHPAPAVSAQAAAQSPDVSDEAVFSIAFQRSLTLQPSARAGAAGRRIAAASKAAPPNSAARAAATATPLAVDRSTEPSP